MINIFEDGEMKPINSYAFQPGTFVAPLAENANHANTANVAAIADRLSTIKVIHLPDKTLTLLTDQYTDFIWKVPEDGVFLVIGYSSLSYDGNNAYNTALRVPHGSGGTNWTIRSTKNGGGGTVGIDIGELKAGDEVKVALWVGTPPSGGTGTCHIVLVKLADKMIREG